MNGQPEPIPQPESDFYWESASNGKLVFQRCSNCDKAQFYPRVYCIHCRGKSLLWEESSGKGTLYTYTIVHSPPHPSFKKDVPYIVGIVELNEGFRIPTSLTGLDPDPQNIAIGMPLEVTFEQVSDAIGLPKFRPARP